MERVSEAFNSSFGSSAKLRAVIYWLAGAYFAAGNTNVGIDPDTQWWHDHVLPYAEIRYLKGRIRFNAIGNPAPFPSVLAVFRPVRRFA